MALKPKGLLIDITKCIGCGACSDNCKAVNDLPKKVDDKLTSNTWTVVKEKAKGRFVRNLCRHCLEPACVSVCPVAALTKTKEGPVVYDKSVCLGCRYCMMACPFGVPTFEWDSNMPRIRKCILCAPRVKEGKSTGCAEACPTEATIFGDRDELIKIAEARIKAKPDQYHNYIYGLDEVGGTSVLFLSPVPFEQLDFDTDLAKYPLPDLTFNILKTEVPGVLSIGTVLLGGSYFLFKRRVQVKEAEAKAAKDAGKEAENE